MQEDSDGDCPGDVCDNCPVIPNGPHLGTCFSPTGIGNECIIECNEGAFCMMRQEDADNDGVGDLCDEVPILMVMVLEIPDFQTIPVFSDNCPIDPNPDQLDSDGDCIGECM